MTDAEKKADFLEKMRRSCIYSHRKGKGLVHLRELRLKQDVFLRLIPTAQACVYGHLDRFGCPTPEREDVFQEALLKAWQQLGSYRGDDHEAQFLAWICTIARNVWLRRRYRKKRVLLANHEELDGYLGTEAESRLKEDRLLADRLEVLQKCLGCLEAAERALLERKYFAGQTADPHVPTTTYYRELSRVLAKVRRCVTRDNGGTRE